MLIMVDTRIDNEKAVDRALKKLKKALDKESVLDDYKKHNFFTKPSVKRRMKRKAAAARRLKEERKANRGV